MSDFNAAPNSNIEPYDIPLPEDVAVPPSLQDYPDIVRLADDPDNQMGMPDDQIELAMNRAKSQSSLDATQGWRVVEDGQGEPHWAAEYRNVFAFDGGVRGKFDYIHKDPAQRDGAQQIETLSGHLEGKFTDVIFETDADETVIIRRTSGDTASAAKQTFELMSTRMIENAGGQVPAPRPIDTNLLKNVVVVPGHPVRLHTDPATGKAPHTEGNVTRITALDMSEAGKVAPSHHRLQQADRYTDARARLNQEFRAARQRAAAAASLGGAALEQS